MRRTSQPDRGRQSDTGHNPVCRGHAAISSGARALCTRPPDGDARRIWHTAHLITVASGSIGAAS